MKNSSILVLAGILALTACSERERPAPAIDNSAQRPDLTLPDTASLADTTFAVSSGGEAVSPAEQTPAAPQPRARRTPRSKPRTPPARAAAPRVDTSTRAYAPPPRDTTPPRDSAAPDTTTAPTSVARATPKPDSAAAPAPDTTTSADTSTAGRPDPAATTAADTAPTTDTTVAATPSPAPTRPSAGRGARTLPIGTEIHAALDDSITSRRDSVGRTVSAHVMENVIGPDGRTLIPAGAPVRFTVTRLRSARSKQSQGRLELRVDGVALNGQLRSVKANVRPVPRELRGRGVTGKEAATVGAGAVGGAVLGRVVGGNTRGAVIGGVAGAAAGAVVASQTATRDVVVKAKTPVVFVLTAPLTTP
jgi:hypothetical protein